MGVIFIYFDYVCTNETKRGGIEIGMSIKGPVCCSY